MQLVSVQSRAPSPELPVSVQLFSAQKSAPSPELPNNAQLFRAQPDAPLPQLPHTMQLFSVPPSAPATPLVRAKPVRVVLVPSDAQRFDVPPLIAVKSGPLTL